MFNFNLFFNPETELENGSKKASIVKGALNYALIPTIIAFVVGILISLAFALLSQLAAVLAAVNPALGLIALFGQLAFIILPVITFVLIAILSLLFHVFIFLGIKIAGGSQASFAEQYYLSSSFLPATYLLVIGLGVLYVVGLFTIGILIGFLLQLIAYAFLFALSFYTSYLFWLAFKTAHKVPNKQLIIGTAIGFFILMIVLAIIIAVIVVALIAAIGMPNLNPQFRTF